MNRRLNSVARRPAEAGINPLIVKAEGQGVVAVDGLLVLADNGSK